MVARLPRPLAGEKTAGATVPFRFTAGRAGQGRLIILDLAGLLRRCRLVVEDQDVCEPSDGGTHEIPASLKGPFVARSTFVLDVRIR